jgi:hypothetical protein
VNDNDNVKKPNNEDAVIEEINKFFIYKIINNMLKHGIYYFTFYCVSNNVGHILLHRYVVKSNLWLMPLVIIMVITIHAINYVTLLLQLENIIKY